MRLRPFSCLLLLAVSMDAAADDLYAAINRLRAGGGNCAAVKHPAPLTPFTPQAALERVARDLSQGVELKQSLHETGYRAARSRVLNFRGEGVGARAAVILAAGNYCPQLQDAGVTQAGIYRDQRQVWIVMAAPFAPAVALHAEAAAQRMLELVNRARATPRNCGERAFKAAPPLRWNGVLAEASRLHAEDMARSNYFSHDGRDGSSPAQRVERAGYRYRAIGENIAAGTQMQPEDAVASWITSPEHCANIMNPAFAEMGVAFAIEAASDMGIYWAKVFGAPR